MATETVEQSDNKVQTLLDQGKHAFTLHDYETSINKFGEACQILDDTFGELASESGDTYFLYGRALLHYAIHQNNVLGQSAADHQTTESADASTATSHKSHIQIEQAPEFHSGDHEEDKANNESTQSGDQDQDEQAAGEESDNDDGEEGEDEAKAEDDFETAWDVLDVARVIFEKSDDDASRLKLADIHLCLGDVSLETEKFAEAANDYHEAIKIKLGVLQEDDRQLAEAYYKHSLALELSNESEKALEEVKKSMVVLEKRLGFLQNKQQSESSPAVADEITEIQELIPDMEAKLEELAQKKKAEEETHAMLKSLLGSVGSASGSNGSNAASTIGNVTANDISGLVKRKKENTNPPAQEEDEPENKVQKTE